MFKKRFNYFTLSLSSLFFITLGVSFLLDSIQTWNWLYGTFVYGVMGMAILKFVNLILNFGKIEKRLSQFSDIIVWSVAVVVLLIFENTFFTILPRVIGCWILLHAIIKIIVLWIRLKDHLPIMFHTIIFLIGDSVMCFFLLINPANHEYIISLFIGMYFIIYAGNTLLDMIREIIPAGSGEEWDQKLRLSVPPFLSVIIPPHLMRTLFNKDKEDQVKSDFEAIKEDIPIDMEVLIHLAAKGPAMLGHADLIYRGLVISYGCYDPHNRHLFGTLGDGVVIMAPRNSYIKNCLENENKVLVSFGISINQEQKDRLNERLLEVFGSFEDFYSDEDLKRAGKPYKGICDDYISRVTRTSKNARFYKIKKGKLKTFFVVSSNCVFFLSNILSVIGFKLFDLSGIVSPGAYYDFLNNQFKSDKGFVVTRKLYRKKDAKQFEDNVEA